MLKQKFYQRVAHPFNIAALCTVLVFFLYGVKNLIGSSDLPHTSAGQATSDPPIRFIEPVEKNLHFKEDVTLNPEINPFVADHKDWIVADKGGEDETFEESDLRLEVLGIVTIRSNTKVVVKDPDDKAGNSFWLRLGDMYKGYTVVHISNKSIIFAGKEKNIRFVLKSGKGKLYSGKGEIFVAPDIDLYLDRLRAEESQMVITDKDKGETAVEDTTSHTAETHVAGPGQAGGLSGKPELPSMSPVSPVSPAPQTGTDQGGQDSPAGTSREDEMAFIREILKIFQQEGKK